MSHPPVGPPYKEEPGSEVQQHHHQHQHHHQPQGSQAQVNSQTHPAAHHPHPPPSSQQQQQQQQQQQHLPPHSRAPALNHHQQLHGPPPSSSYPSPHGPPPPQQQQPPPPQQEIPQYYAQAHQSPYGPPSASGSQYQQHPADGPALMATHAMSRPTYPPIYHTPQANSPASVASPTASDHRSVYQPQPMPTLYDYQQQYAQMQQGPPSYATQPPPHHITSQPLLMSHSPTQSVPPQHHQHVGAPPPPPQTQQNGPPKVQQQQQAPLHKPAGSGSSSSGKSGSSINPNAAPGPIPATTPLVVRQDNNGVQWIMFEYSRDRVKMEYTIRCDVESVNVDQLSPEFKTENCVYPRACCTKEQYRGNRLVYETECNNVGWALAQLNPPLRGKRGLIQRAVDSWRNSNQDPRLRSRRVRRMAKLNNRKASAQQQPPHIGAGSPVNALPSSTVTGMAMKPNAPMMNNGTMQHHHHQPGPDGSSTPTNGTDEGISSLLQHHASQQSYANQMSSGQTSRSTSGHLSPAVGNAEFGNGHHQPADQNSDVRPRHIFHGGYTSYPADTVTHTGPGGTALPPNIHHADNLDGLGAPPNHPAPVSTSSSMVTPPPSETHRTPNTALFGDIPEHKQRKFILVDDPQRNSRVRVRVTLDQVQMQEIPDSYRKSNSVYPRSFISTQRELDDDSARNEVHTMVKVDTMDGSEMTVMTPMPSEAKRRKEENLNELGYRMSWSQSRVFAGRLLFLQTSLDAYRNKTRSSMMANGSDVAAVAPHLETRVGKRKWQERARRSRAAAATGSADAGNTTALA
ncbi:hypothetical protein EX30DRAFT_399424 [Ascodesmis nigricans]|uniref:DUF8032 domain-containing protein n=1 Tax=Ascodesmis nigricans TaxID=341454 RepID=A0A4S2MHJ1_9PEZI|nr:hypothetical protein EX30DRAFT_399424 [Ascodesmis nigricans]